MLKKQTFWDKAGDTTFSFADNVLGFIVPGWDEQLVLPNELEPYYNKSIEQMSSDSFGAAFVVATAKYLKATDHMVYVLKDSVGNVVCVGRTRFPKARKWVHKKKKGKHLKFKPLFENLTYEQARGLEDIKYLEYKKAAEKSGKKLLNKIRPIGLKNKKAVKYLREGVEYLLKIAKKIK